MAEFLNIASFNKMDVLGLPLLKNSDITQEDIDRLRRYKDFWDFYEGYHWQDKLDSDSVQVTFNYCRAFVNKFVAFELGKGFSIKMKPEIEPIVLPFLNSVWDNNNVLKFCNELGQMKSVTGDAWVQVFFEAPGEFNDPFNEFERGRIRVIVVPADIVFPEYDSYDRDKLLKLKIMYPIVKNGGFFNNPKKVMYKQVWTEKSVEIFEGEELIESLPNKYGFIPFVHLKNLILAGKNFGVSDLEDIIPLNTEFNLKSSDVSEIIDYHSAPVTVIFGARVGQLEKGANKVWGGLPEKARVENLELKGDLGVSQQYLERIKQAMHEVAGIPESSLGKSEGISNTSGVALQVALMPLIEKIKVKQALTAEGLEKINKMIIKIGLTEGLLELPEFVTVVEDDREIQKKISIREVYDTEIVFEDALPKDALVQLQQIAIEMKLGLCDREEAMQRLGKDNIQQRLEKIDKERMEHPVIYGIDSVEKWMELNPDEIFPPQEEVTTSNTKSKVGVMNREIAENKNHQDAEVNSGLTNSPMPKMSKVGL